MSFASCFFKHEFHIVHIGHVPVVERLVEGRCVTKHKSHIRDTFQSLNGWLREVAFLNIALISVTLDTFREVLEPAAGTFAGRPARRVLAPHPARNARELFVLGGGAKYPQQRARGGEYCGLVRPQGSGILLRGSPGALT